MAKNYNLGTELNRFKSIVVFAVVAGVIIGIDRAVDLSSYNWIYMSLLVGATVFAIYFHRVNLGLFMLMIVGLIALGGIQSGVEAKDFVWVSSWYLITGYALLLLLFKDSGVLSISTLVKLLLIVATLLAMWAVIDLDLIEAVVVKLTYIFIDDKKLGLFAAIPQVALVIGAVALIIAAFKDEMIFYMSLMAIMGVFYDNLAVMSGGGAVVVIILLMMRSYRLAYYDELTAIPNRRALFEAANRLGGRYSVAMGDIDFFKKFNDTHGHDVGDLVLKMVAKKLSKVKGGGKAFRYGGEEFTIVFDGKSASESEKYLEEVRKSVESSSLVHKGKRLAVTVSLGVSNRDDKSREFEQVMKSADEALYKAKELGRNRVVVK